MFVNHSYIFKTVVKNSYSVLKDFNFFHLFVSQVLVVQMDHTLDHQQFLAVSCYLLEVCEGSINLNTAIF